MTTYESKQLLKPVISITEGIELGTVSDIIIDGENKKVIALGITKDKLFYKALCVIPFEKIPFLHLLSSAVEKFLHIQYLRLVFLEITGRNIL